MSMHRPEVDKSAVVISIVDHNFASTRKRRRIYDSANARQLGVVKPTANYLLG